MRRVYNNIRNHSNWFNYYIHKYLNSREEGFTFNCRGGLKIKVPQRLAHTYKECFFDETYTKGLPKRLIKKLAASKPLTVIDIGANVGYFSLFMLSNFRGSKVYAFEPIGMNFKLLKQYKEENSNLHFTVVNQAVGGQQGTIVLNYDAGDQFTTSASIFDNRAEPDQVEVQCTTLEAILEKNKLNKIDFLKLDCEGSEYDIVYGAPSTVLDKVSVIAIETHKGKTENKNRDALANYLEQNKFEIHTSGDIIWGWKATAAMK